MLLINSMTTSRLEKQLNETMRVSASIGASHARIRQSDDTYSAQTTLALHDWQGITDRARAEFPELFGRGRRAV